MTSPARQLVDTLGQALDRRQREQPGRLRTARVVGRQDDGRQLLMRLDGTCQVGGEIGPEAVGDLVTLPAGPLSSRGTAGVALNSVSRAVDTLWVERLVPDLYNPGRTYNAVQVIGRGFSQRTRVEFLDRHTDLVNEDIQITATRFVDSELLEVDITLTADARISTKILPDGTVVQDFWDLAYGNV